MKPVKETRAQRFAHIFRVVEQCTDAYPRL
jgi:hypothetical protein